MIHLITTTVRVVPEIRFGVKSFFLRNRQIPLKEQSLFIVNIYRLNHRKLIWKISCYVTNSKRFAASTKSFSDSFMWIFTMILWSFDNQKVCILTQKVFYYIIPGRKVCFWRQENIDVAILFKICSKTNPISQTCLDELKRQVYKQTIIDDVSVKNGHNVSR